MGGHTHRAAALMIAAVVAATGAAFATPRAEADSLAINNTDYVPANISPGYFYSLASAVAAGWGIGVDGSTNAVGGDRDGTQALSFSPALGFGTLGRYTVWYHHVYSYQRVCYRSGRAGKRRCYRRRIFRYDQIDEADVAINSNVYWNQGPRYPKPGEYDLQTVLIHELGHFADPNQPHQPRCSGSPLTESLDTGEWWRSATDWYEGECRNSPSSPKIASRSAGHGGARFVVVRYRLPDRIVPLSGKPHISASRRYR